MSKPSRRAFFAGMLVPLCAFGFLVWSGAVRLREVQAITRIGESPAAEGRTAWQPRLIVPQHDNASYEWLDQTRQMFSHRELRVRHIDYENAPFGHEVYAASPYRWWLGLIAWCDHEISGRPLGEAVERAALVADPLLHLLLLAGTAGLVGWQFGALAAALVSFGLAALFPLAAGFLPGAPDDHNLAYAGALWTVLPLLAGWNAIENGRVATRWFFVGGVMGGLALWVSVAKEAPILVGIGIGGLLAAWIGRGGAGAPATPALRAPWRAWAVGGALTILAAYLLEFFPSHLGLWQFRAIHPLLGVAWLGGGEALARLTGGFQRGKFSWNLRRLGWGALVLVACAALPVAMWLTHDLGFLAVDLPAMRLTRLPDGIAAANFAQWIAKDGVTATVWATLLPLVLVVPAVWLLVRRTTGLGPRSMIAVAVGPIAVALGFACRQLSWWNEVDGVMIALLVAITAHWNRAPTSRYTRWKWVAAVSAGFLPGALLCIPRVEAGMNRSPEASDVFTLVERDLARWLASHAGPGGAVVLAPHNLTATFYYYAGMRGLATFGWENRDGLEAAVRIASASTPEEAKELIDRRGITHLVIPSWDPYLDVYARMGMGQLEGTFLERLHSWRLPLWLRPVSYQLPTIAGFEGQSVAILEVVDEQDNATSLSRLAEYFVETGHLDEAASVAQALRRFPANMGAWVARAQVEIAREDAEGLAGSFKVLLPRLSSNAVRALPWDRRAALAIVLARGKHLDLAPEQVRRCLAEADETKLRALSASNLYGLLVLARAFDLRIENPKLHDLALSLVPSDLRSRLAP